MLYTVGEMAKRLGIAPLRSDITIKKVCSHLLNVPAAVSECSKMQTLNGCR